jgi:hypothetical protein
LLRDQPYAGAGVPTSSGYFWVRRPKQPGRANRQLPGELMLSPLDGSQPRKLADGVMPRLDPSKGGVYWPRIDPKVEGRFDLVFTSADGKTQRVLKEYGSTVVPQEAGGRLYWIAETRKRAVSPPGTAFPSMLVTRELVSAALDGSDRRPLLKLAEGGKLQVGLKRIQAHNGKLYGLMWETGAPGRDGEPARDRTYLCEVRPGSEPVLRKLCEFPTDVVPTGYFDGDSFYFTQQEMQENWRNWSRGGMSPTPVEALYRFRLPK